MTLALEILTVTLGAFAMLSVLPASARRRRSKRRGAASMRPESLERLERLMPSSGLSASDLHVRLRPVIREIAAIRLSRRGVVLDRDAAQTQKLLGSELWELVRADRPRPKDPRGHGISLERLAAMIDRLEAL